MKGQLATRAGAYVLTAELALILCGCATGNNISPTLKTPDIEHIAVGQRITQAAANNVGDTGSVTWWKFYQDPQLAHLLEIAMQEAPSIQTAAAHLHRAEAVLDLNKPSITGGAQIAGDRFPDHYTYPAPYAGSGGSDGSLTVNVRYHLDFWGKRREAQAAAGEQLKASQAEVADATLLLETAVMDAYIDLDLFYKTRDLAASALGNRLEIISMLAARQKAGLATDIDAIHANEAVTVTRGEIARLDSEITQRKSRIAALLGQDPGFAEQIERPSLVNISDPAPLSAIPSVLLGYRPDVALRRAEVDAAAHEIGVAKAAFYPDVDLTAFAGLMSLDVGYLLRAGSTALNAGPVLTLPIFDGGRLRSTLKGRTAEYDAAVANYRATLSTALQQVADGIALLESEQLRRNEAKTAEAHWRHVAELQDVRVRHGFSTAMDLLTAKTELLLRQRQLSEAEARIASAQIALIRALGGAWAPSSNS
ncbi:efflux transporter outer membrane subunit [Solimicrobium silvestre]|uniref:Efflux transporter, outer membrane factor (OMF) lipoprotein, NodT family n=1 Tax=Solimicrobium silvestre TaxID=2099400 RepID=A0A2S9H279_9BURK|nr:efflux transporter outer membrane subunit [Solimicrobium silvestre]PRC94084.1 Efflux transporter, outer membrane factor (OMF) lipoprotein, NodT family [Solimicrobium silvestre]